MKISESQYRHFYPRSPCGERHRYGRPIDVQLVFLSTLSLRRATAPPYNLMIYHKNFYPRSPCGERPCILTISICIVSFLSTLSLRRATMHALKFANFVLFLSTLSLRRATSNESSEHTNNSNFYPRSPCGERLQKNQHQRKRKDISIHALLAESDVSPDTSSTQCRLFLSTLSLRRATARPTANNATTIFLSTLSLRRATEHQ